MNWERAKLKDIAEKITKGSTPTTYGYKYLDRGIPFVKVENLENGRIDHSSISQYISAEAHEFQQRSQLMPGDILFSIAGTIGRVAMVYDCDTPANTNQAIAIIRGTNKYLKPNFLKVLLESNISSEVRNKARGGAMNNISLSDLQEMDIIVPSFDEQVHIIDTIETQFTRLDAAVKSLKAIKSKFEIYRQSVLNAVFIQADSGARVTVKEISSFIGSGITPKGGKKIYLDEGVPFIRSQNIYPFKFVASNLAYVDETLHKSMKRTHTKPNDVLLNITGASIGRCAVMPEDIGEANVNQHVCIIRPIETILPDYLCAFLNSQVGQGQIMASQGGVTRQGLNYQQLRKIQVPLPDIDKQRETIAEIESRFSVIDKVEEVVDNALLKAERLRKSILKSAFEGKLA